jgi:hypothetical protein
MPEVAGHPGNSLMMSCERAVMHPARDVAPHGRSIRHASDCTREKIDVTSTSVVSQIEKRVHGRMTLIRVRSERIRDPKSGFRFTSTRFMKIPGDATPRRLSQLHRVPP